MQKARTFYKPMANLYVPKYNRHTTTKHTKGQTLLSVTGQTSRSKGTRNIWFSQWNEPHVFSHHVNCQWNFNWQSHNNLPDCTKHGQCDELLRFGDDDTGLAGYRRLSLCLIHQARDNVSMQINVAQR